MSVLEPFALPPDMLLQERRPKLGESVGRIVEGSEQRLSFTNREGQDPHLRVDGSLETPGELPVEAEASELKHVVVSDWNPGQHDGHDGEGIA